MLYRLLVFDARDASKDLKNVSYHMVLSSSIAIWHNDSWRTILTAGISVLCGKLKYWHRITIKHQRYCRTVPAICKNHTLVYNNQNISNYVLTMTQFLPTWTYDPTWAALMIESSSMNTWSPMWSGKKATLKHTNSIYLHNCQFQTCYDSEQMMWSTKSSNQFHYCTKYDTINFHMW